MYPTDTLSTMSMANTAGGTARTREVPLGEEEATSDLKLGEFQDVPSMTLSEARAVIVAVVEHRAKSNKGKIEETE